MNRERVSLHIFGTLFGAAAWTKPRRELSFHVLTSGFDKPAILRAAFDLFASSGFDFQEGDRKSVV